MTQLSFSVIGGDLRQSKLCNNLISHGYQVNRYGVLNSDINPLAKQCYSLEEAVSNVDVIIGPIPCSQNDKDLFLPYHQKKITVKELVQVTKKDQILMTGRITPKIQEILSQHEITSIDLLRRDDMAILNAIPTNFCYGYFF